MQTSTQRSTEMFRHLSTRYFYWKLKLFVTIIPRLLQGPPGEIGMIGEPGPPGFPGRLSQEDIDIFFDNFINTYLFGFLQECLVNQEHPGNQEKKDKWEFKGRLEKLALQVKHLNKILTYKKFDLNNWKNFSSNL